MQIYYFSYICENFSTMIGTLLWRIKEAFAILIGKKKAEVRNVKSQNLDFDIEIPQSIKQYISTLKIEFIFTEFGETRVNAGGSVLSNNDRLNPSLSGIKKFFPNAKITVFTDFDWDIEGINIQKVVSPVVSPEHPRFGYRTGNYFKFKGLIESDADFVCALDTDMFFVNEKALSLVTLTQKFGFCVANNTSRQIISQDLDKSLDIVPITDDSLGSGHSYNQSPMTLWRGDKRGTEYYKTCMEIMRDDPSRGSLVMWKAAWKTSIHPYALPRQFCVCSGDEGCEHEIILHIGHPSVSEYYNIKI